MTTLHTAGETGDSSFPLHTGVFRGSNFMHRLFTICQNILGKKINFHKEQKQLQLTQAWQSTWSRYLRSVQIFSKAIKRFCWTSFSNASISKWKCSAFHKKVLINKMAFVSAQWNLSQNQKKCFKIHPQLSSNLFVHKELTNLASKSHAIFPLSWWNFFFYVYSILCNTKWNIKKIQITFVFKSVQSLMNSIWNETAQ